MRKAAGIILITLGVLFLCAVIYILVVVDILTFINFLTPFPGRLPLVVSMLFLVVPIAFYITGGIFCLRRKYWRVCLASASFAILFSVFFPFLFPLLSLAFILISMGWIILVVLVPEVISVIFIVRKKKEWEEISDSVDGKVSYDG